MGSVNLNNGHYSSANEDSANINTLIAVVDDTEATSRRLSARLRALAPPDWGSRLFTDFDAAVSHSQPPVGLLALSCDDNVRFDTRALMQRVKKADGIPLMVAGAENCLPTRVTCARAGVCQRIATDEDVELIDARLRWALNIAIDRHRLGEFERHSGGARARLTNGRITGATSCFAELIGVESVETINGQSLDHWLSETDSARLAAAQAQLEAAKRPAGCGVILRRANFGAGQPLSAHLYGGAEQDHWLSLAPLEAVSIPLLGLNPMPDTRMALHRHLASINLDSTMGSRGLVFVAIDGILPLQQQFGLASTDALLEEVGLFLIELLAESDRCFRFAAGEYVLSIERGAADDIIREAETLVRAVGGHAFDSGERSTHLTASVSAITLGTEPTTHDKRLQQLVDIGYRLREAGGDTFQDCGNDLATDGDIWPTRLEMALAADRFRLAFQAVTNLANDHRRYYDVLLRYLDNHDGLIMPGNFMPAAEQAGLMPEIDRWVARNAAGIIAEQAKRGTVLTLFVKVSAATLQHTHTFTTWLAKDQAMGAIDHQQIIFCIRESDARAQIAATQQLCARLDRLGFRFALNHFGESSNPETWLGDLQLSFIKLAPAFSRQLADRNGGNERLQHIVDYARRQRIPMIAEHIEDAASMAQLWQAGVNYVQGHFIQEPDPAALQSGQMLD